MPTVIYADASYDRYKQQAGICVVITRYKHGHKPISERFQTRVESNDSNLAELQAVLYGVQQLKDDDKNVIILTDNKNVRQIIKRPNREEYAGNRSEFGLAIRKLLDGYSDRKYRVYHIKGHTDFKGKHYKNQQWCDTNARKILRKER